MLTNPLTELTAAQQAVKELVDNIDAGYAKTQDDTFFVGFEGSFGANHVTPRGLSARMLGKMVCVEGIVSKCTLIHPKVVKSVHYCEETEETTQRSYRDATSIDGAPTLGLYPKEDDAGHKLTTEYGLSVYKNHQRITMQEMPERAPAGQLPRSVEIILDNDLVDAAKPGDRIQVMGIYRAMPNKKDGSTTGVFNTVLLANNVVELGKQASMPPLTEVDVKRINQVARSKKTSPFQLLAASLAPSIHGHDHIKQGILCLLLGGEERNLLRGGHIRGDVNCLLVGDPSCGKSQMLRFVQNTAPHCITTTGRGSSGVGLTAAVTTDQETGERRLEAGAMVLADRGIVCIDEFDKMSDLDRVSIHEVMEQQTVTIAKAGLHTSLNARCSVLAAANPVYGQYDPFQTPMDNIGLPDSLLSRFDLLFIVLDKMDPELDSNLAEHVLRSHLYRNPTENDGDPMRIETSADTVIAEAPEADEATETTMYAKHAQAKRLGRRASAVKLLSMDFCKKFILYAKARCHPRLSEQAASYIATSYSRLRSKEEDSKTLPVTARTLETMIRLSTAHAKTRLSDTVEEKDAKVALDLINFAYYNEAKPLDKPRKKSRGAHDGPSDSEGDSGDEGPSQGTPRSAAATPRAKSKRSPKSTPRKRGKGGDEERDEAPAEQRALQGEKRKGASKEYNPYDFEEDAPSPAGQKTKKPRAASTPSQQSPAEAKAASGAMETEEDAPAEAVAPATPLTEARKKAFRGHVSELFKLKRARQMNRGVLLDGVNQLHKGDAFSTDDATDVLKASAHARAARMHAAIGPAHCAVAPRRSLVCALHPV